MIISHGHCRTVVILWMHEGCSGRNMCSAFVPVICDIHHSACIDNCKHTLRVYNRRIQNQRSQCRNTKSVLRLSISIHTRSICPYIYWGIAYTNHITNISNYWVSMRIPNGDWKDNDLICPSHKWHIIDPMYLVTNKMNIYICCNVK